MSVRNMLAQGVTEACVRAMLKTAGGNGSVDRVCEIGPGIRPFAVKIIVALIPSAYQS